MDRRKFLSGIGAIGGIGAVATGVAFRESGEAQARAGRLAQAAGAGGRTATAAGGQASKALAVHGMSLGYLPGSAGMLASPTVERLMRTNATGLRWARWDAASAAQAHQASLRSLFRSSTLVDLTVGTLRRVQDPAASGLQGLDITVHVALDDAPYSAPFTAWHYESAKPATAPKSSRFLARVPDRAALEVTYALDQSAVADGVSRAGMIYLPVGATAATAGLATGLYVLAATSVDTGMQPDLGAYVFSGDVNAPLADPFGRAPDFEYLALAIRPIAV